MVNVNFITAKT